MMPATYAATFDSGAAMLHARKVIGYGASLPRSLLVANPYDYFHLMLP